MDEPTLDNLARRLSRLERENKRFKRIGGLVLAGIAAGALMGQMRTVADTIEAKQFIVRDASGKPRATLGAAADGSLLELYDKEGERRAVLGVVRDGSVVLSLLAKGETGGVWLSAAPHGWSTLQFGDRRGTARMRAGLTPDGAAMLVANDSNGATRAGLGIAADDKPFRFP